MTPTKPRKSAQGSSRGPAVRRGLLRHLIVRIGAVAALGVVAALALMELHELRGELACARFHQLRKLAAKTRYLPAVNAVAQSASGEASLALLFGRGNPEALASISDSSLEWSRSDRLEPVLRLHMAEMSLRAALLAVRAAPTDYEKWLSLARAHAALGLVGQRRLCLERALELAPPGMEIELSWL